ncbi:transketolase, partial [Candidatus Woesearchaeota archaeon]|nr:transketolase [Candidatus Woesearchaeota archaeon]
MLPTRDGFGKGLVKAGQKNKNVVALSADLSESTRTHWFQAKFPSRFFEIGVAEQNLITVASGMAHLGKIPFTTSYATFQPGRCLEQIRTTIAYNNQPVKVVGCHAGISVGPDGATHQALEDLSWMRTMPNMHVFVPADANEAEKITLASVQLGPCYIRLGREKTAVFTEKRAKFEVGKAQVLRGGNDVTIIGCGPQVFEALQAARSLEKKNIKARVINLATIKPIDKKTLVKAAKDTGVVVTIEEHQILGGMGSAVAEVLSEHYPVPQLRLGIQDRFGESGSPDELL